MNVDLIRAWKDESYRETLTPEQQAALPANPAGAIELNEEELANVDGAMTPTPFIIGSLISLNYGVWFTARGDC